jgi:hypothetical protein
MSKTSFAAFAALLASSGAAETDKAQKLNLGSDVLKVRNM